MSFKEKIDKILETNTLGVNTINALEKEIGASTGSVNKYYNWDKSAGAAIVKKIKKTFGISDDDWRTGNIGRTENKSAKQRFMDEIDDEPFVRDMWKTVKKDNAKFQQEIDRLWGLIERLDLPGDAIKRVPSENS
jgi:hypothetical protein